MQIGWQSGELIDHIVGNVVHEPLEGFAIETLLQCQLLAYVAHVQVTCQWLTRIEELLVGIIEPSLNHALVVNRDQRTLLLAGQLAEIVRHKATIDMAHARAGNPFDAATALPDLKAQLEVLAAPDK